MLEAFRLRNDDISLAKEVFRCLYMAQENKKLVELFESAGGEVKENSRCVIYYAYALARCGRLDEAEKLIVKDGKYLVLPDIREAETMTSDLWEFIRQARLAKGEDAPELPKELDFRMLYNLADKE
jgi:hypothetical protein